MRVCEKHMNRAVETLVSRMTGTEYDLCDECLKELEKILHGENKVTPCGVSEFIPDGAKKILEALKEYNKSEKTSEKDGRKRTAGRPKTAKS